MKRSVTEPPLAPSAVWTRRLALLGAGLSAAAVVMAHGGTDRVETILTVLALGLSLAGFACLAALRAAGNIWRNGTRGIGRVLVGLVVAAATLAYPAFLAATRPLDFDSRDMTTDPQDPPRLSGSARVLAARGFATGSDGAPPRRVVLSAAASDALTLDVPVAEAMTLVVSAMKQLHWSVIETVQPGSGPEGRIDAVVRTTVLRFPDDVAVRIRRTGGGSRIDVRSVGRLAVPDLGEVARNIQRLLDGVADQIEAE